MNYEIISFYTVNTPYEREAEKMKESLEKLGLSTEHIQPRKNLKNWHKNCCMKPYFIDEKLRELNKPVVWIDCDARVVKNPVLFEELIDSDYDISVHFHKDKELLSGTLFLRPTDKIFKLLYYWKFLLKEDMESGLGTPPVWNGLEQSALQYLLTSKYKTFRVKGFKLPKEYIYVSDLGWWSDVKDPIIVHGQASRRYKQSLNI